jgi:hypothetical protein
MKLRRRSPEDYLSICTALVDLGRFFSFLIYNTVGRTSWTVNQLVARPLPTHRITQTENKRTQISMAVVGFESTTTVFELAKTVHVLDRAATVIGNPEDIHRDNLQSYRRPVAAKSGSSKSDNSSDISSQGVLYKATNQITGK